MTVEITSEFVTLRAGGTLIVLAASKGGRARMVYAGPDLQSASPEDLVALAARQHAPGGPEQPIAPSLLNCIGTGHPSPPGLLAHSRSQHWALDPRVAGVKVSAPGQVTILTRDEPSGLMVGHSIALCEASGVANFATALSTNTDTDFALEWCSALCLPLDPRFSRLTSFTGKWAREFQTEELAPIRGSFLRENRAGRTSHDSYPGFYCGTDTTGEGHGVAAAFHLAWNGNHRLRLDRLADETFSLQAGELLLPGEITITKGMSYVTPTLLASFSDEGYGAATRGLHRWLRANRLKPDLPRPVHYNTWEAVYFDQTPGRLFALAKQAAEVGAERFVLDDGWFGARRNDRAGLGDWHVSDAIYPDGLKPLADHVRSLGMEFGLWFEPEMVNPDSDLYRAHPDWVLEMDEVEPIASRHQLPVDMTLPVVRDYLFERIDSLVSDLGIAYIKWDMNRDIQHPGGADGRPAAHRNAKAIQLLLDRLREAHPDLVIESCSSGGARADYAMLERTDRVWTSDNNDARARHAIMRGAGYFLPLEVLGNHVGPKTCHITGRRFPMHFRAGTAVFGHMGMELDLAKENDADRAVLAKAIDLYKAHRALIHSGDYYRLETASHINAIGVVSANRDEALYQVAILDQHPAPHPPRLHFAGLGRDRRYRLAIEWPEHHAAEISTFTGSALMDYGLQLPQSLPDTCLIYHLKEER
ncbi:alpha-galactosidase [Erythrobacter litoralis]|nr:alpha-galactosidase [Erythrobacter litoralis]